MLRTIFVCFLLFLILPAKSFCQISTIVHDPFVIKANDYFYLVGTGRGIPIRRSKDLVHWEPSGNGFVFDDPPFWTRDIIAKRKQDGMKDDIWGPAIFYFNGKYHLYFSVAVFGTNNSRIGLATSKTLNPDSPDYKWIDQGLVMESIPGRDDFNAIENEIVFDSQGNPWLLFGSFFSGIKIRRIDFKTGKISLVNPKIYTIASREGDRSIENPSLFYKNGYWYLFVSFDLCCQGEKSTYNIRVGRSKNMLGPYIDKKGTPMLKGGGTLILASYENVRGPGCNSIFVDNKKEFLVHHFYDGDDKGVPKLHIRPVVWEKDGWPLLGEPYQGINPHNSIDGKWDISAGFEGGLRFETDFLKNGMANQFGAKWSLKGSDLTIDWPSDNAPGGVWKNKCIMSSDGSWFVGRNQAGAIIRGKKIQSSDP